MTEPTPMPTRPPRESDVDDRGVESESGTVEDDAEGVGPVSVALVEVDVPGLAGIETLK